MREEFLKQIDDFLVGIGFVKNENVYTRESRVQGKGQSMIINGQRYDQPGPIMNIKQQVTLEGEGVIYNDKDEEEYKFEVISLSIFNNNEMVDHVSQGFYYNDIKLFKNMINKL